MKSVSKSRTTHTCAAPRKEQHFSRWSYCLVFVIHVGYSTALMNLYLHVSRTNRSIGETGSRCAHVAVGQNPVPPVNIPMPTIGVDSRPCRPCFSLSKAANVRLRRAVIATDQVDVLSIRGEVGMLKTNEVGSPFIASWLPAIPLAF